MPEIVQAVWPTADIIYYTDWPPVSSQLQGRAIPALSEEGAGINLSQSREGLESYLSYSRITLGQERIGFEPTRLIRAGKNLTPTLPPPSVDGGQGK